MMDWSVNASTAVAALVGSLVGLRLLALARRTGHTPELAIGLGLFSYAALAQASRFLTLALGEEAAPELRVAAVAIRMIGYVVTLGGLAFFTWQVFGADSLWRRLLASGVCLAGLVSAVAIVHNLWIQYTAGPKPPVYWGVLLGVSFLVTFAWTSAEALRYHGLMRRRRALGLADPVIANRFLVWGAGAGLSTALTVVPVLMSLAGRANDPLASLATTAAGLVNAVVWWLSFMPPGAYLRWIQGASATTPRI
jgi:hypothetical protein